MATTTRLKKSPAASVLNRGAMSTPAKPAKSDDNAHAKADTRSAAIAVQLGHPAALDHGPHPQHRGRVNRNIAASASVATTATPIVTSSSRLNRYTPNGS